MFDQFKTMGAIAGLLKNKEQLQASVQEVKEQLESMRITGRAGDGAATAVVSGRMEVLEIRIEPTLASSLGSDHDARRQGEALIAEAVNDAMTKAQAAAQEAISEQARAMGLPDLGPQISGMLR